MGKTKKKKITSTFRHFYDSAVKWAKRKTTGKNRGIRNRTKYGLRSGDFDIDPRKVGKNESEWEL